jgi:hypothetical protein
MRRISDFVKQIRRDRGRLPGLSVTLSGLSVAIVGYLGLSVTLYSIPNPAINIRITPIGRFCLSDGSTGAARLRGRREIAATIGHLGIP